VDYDSCLQFAIEKCTSDANCSYFTVATKQSVRNAYGYNLYEEDAGSYLKENDDWNTFQKTESTLPIESEDEKDEEDETMEIGNEDTENVMEAEEYERNLQELGNLENTIEFF